MTDRPFKIDTSENSSKKKRKGPLFWILAAAVFVTVVDLVGVLIPQMANWKTAREHAVATPAQVAVEKNEIQPTDKDEIPQWDSPTTGKPISLKFVPSGTQAILHLRPAELVAHDEGEKVLAALGPWGEWAIQQIELSSGMKLAEIETLLIALHRDDDAWQCTLRMTLVTPWSQQVLKQRTTELSSKNHVLFSPKSGKGRVLVSCPSAIVEELIEQGDEPAILTRDLERLLPLTDVDRTATLLMPAKFLETTGSELFLNGGESLRNAFHAIIPDNASAVAISLDWHKDFFCELQANIVQNAPPQRFEAQVKQQLQEAEQQIAALLAAEPASAHAKVIAERFPAMLKTLSQHTRTSHENGIAIARCYLPLQAGHNLLLAAELTVNRSRLSGPLVPETTVANMPITQQLDQLTTLSFPKETLENALQTLAADLKIPIQIAGRDLQLEGITKNQTLKLDLHDRPSGEILVELLRLANPDRTATGPADPRQKLVYVIRSSGIIVTTRSAAVGRGEELPAVFRVPKP